MELRRRSLVAILTSGLIAGVAGGMMVPLIPLALDDRGVGVAIIGLYSAVPSLLFLVAGPFLPRLVVRFGALEVYAAGLGLSAMVLFLFAVVDNLGAWLLFNAVLGLSFGFLWIGSDSWINSVVAERARGRIVALSAASCRPFSTGGPWQLVCGIASVIGAALIPFSFGSLGVLWPLLFLWGGAVAGLYTMSSILAGQRFRGEELAGALTALALAYTVGSLVGPLIGGVMLGAFPPHGIVVVLALVPAVFAVLSLSRARRPGPSGS